MTAPAPLLDAALGYAARGWPVFPCNPKNKQPLLAADRDGEGQKIRGTGGVSKATTDAAQIRAWWRKWPKAMVGLATGHPTTADAHGNADPRGLRLFVLDFDPRTDGDTGEVFTLERLKADTEAQLGCALPESVAGLTPSDGVHLYLLQGDDGPPITNRGNLPAHVDVRGLGGYVVAPPSVMDDGRRYRWHRREVVGGIALAPDALLAVLRERKSAKPASAPHPAQPGRAGGQGPSPAAASSGDDAIDQARRKYALAALDNVLRDVRGAKSGGRNAALNAAAFSLGSLVAAGVLDATMARASLEAAARDNPGRDDAGQLAATIDSGWSAGMAQSFDLSDIGIRAGRGAGRAPGQPARPRPAAAAVGGDARPFRHGRMADQPRGGGRGDADSPAARVADLDDVTKARLQAIAEAWLLRVTDAAKALYSSGTTPPTGCPGADAMRKAAWGAGRRIQAGLLDVAAVKEVIWKATEGKAAPTHADIDQAIEEGGLRGFAIDAQLLDLKCAGYPMTDFGIAERFRDRFGDDYRFTTAKGWLGWDGRRWKVLDQEKDAPPAEIIAAVFETVRAIQGEGHTVAGTGVRLKLERDGKREWVDDVTEPNPHALDYWIPKGRGFTRFSAELRAFGRKSETAGKPGAIAGLAHRWLTVPIEDFDCEQLAINCLNGTLRIIEETTPEGRKAGSVRLDPHRRGDLVTRLAPVDYDPRAAAPRYDAMLGWAQPEPAMQRYLHQVGGYGITGDTTEHKLWFHYGMGRNGKSTTIELWSAAVGDYGDTIGIDSFLDQGVKKRGDAATPDLAKLGGVRLLRASEPERGAKLNSALIKSATGGEPMSVRALHRGFFNLLPRFKLHISGNTKPAIPDTDDGIWSRMKLVPWRRNIERPDLDPFAATFPVAHWPEKDTKLVDKIKADELPGVFARLVRGLVDWVEQGGFTEPDAVKAATQAYRDQSDPLARFLRLCTVLDANERVKSSELFDVFDAWRKVAGESEWKAKGFASAMIDKGFEKTRSDGMRWVGLKLTKFVSDFVDSDGRPRTDIDFDDIPITPAPPGGGAGDPSKWAKDDDDDLPPL